jgi:lysophospholipase L1-like esterase
MRRFFRRLSVAVTVAAVVIGGAEIAFQLRSAALQRWRVDNSEKARRARAYRQCTEQHPHPHYGFFFPLEPQERLALGNGVCSLDADGFREPGPGHAGSRKLAFVLGGSALFGDYASSNEQTITSHLNKLQAEYFFVNAGVPSWNSTQELMRVVFDIVDRRPSLIVAFDGANDAVLAGQIRWRTGRSYPPGTPEFFDVVEALIADDSAPFGNRLHWDHLFPELTLRWKRFFPSPSDDVADDDLVSGADITAAARRYRANHERMAELARAAGARFVSVFQPVANLHHRRDETQIPRRPLIEAFHREVNAIAPYGYEFIDFSNSFDGAFGRIALAEPTLTGDAVFIDPVHLTDRGNALIADRLWNRLLSTQGPPSP